MKCPVNTFTVKMGRNVFLYFSEPYTEGLTGLSFIGGSLVAGDAACGESRAKGLGVFDDASDLATRRLYSFARGQFEITY